jgi:Flp pilus assembly protein TadD
MLLGEVLDAANQPEQATAEFEAAVKAAPREPEVHFGLGYLYWKQKRYDEARREFQAELANQPQHAQALAHLGDSEMHGDDKGAADHLRQALKLDPKLRLAHLDLGIVLAASGDAAGAESHFREAIRLDPSGPDAHYRLGRLFRSLGRTEDAEAEFAKVKELGQEQPQPPLLSVKP